MKKYKNCKSHETFDYFNEEDIYCEECKIKFNKFGSIIKINLTIFTSDGEKHIYGVHEKDTKWENGFLYITQRYSNRILESSHNRDYIVKIVKSEYVINR